MVYTPSIPNAADDPSQSQGLMKSNFENIDTLIAVNHVPFGDSGEGKHNFVSLPEQAAVPTTAANEVALYSKEDGGVASLFYRKESNGAEVPLAGESTLSTNGKVTIAGLTIQWGVASSGLITFPTAFTTVYSVTATPVATTAFSSFGISNGSITATKFNTSSSGAINSVNWIAIGVL